MRPNDSREVIEVFSKPVPLPTAFEYLFENASDAIYILDMRGNFVAVNRKAEELTGFKREGFIGKSFRKIIPAKSYLRAARGFLDVIKGKSIRLELELKTAGKKTVLVEVTSTPFISNGKTVGTLGIVRDITERKKAERALQESEERFRTLMEETPISICNVDLTGKITYVNKSFEEATGYSRDEVVGKNGFKLGLMSDETLKLFAGRMKERLMGKPSRLSEGRFKRKDGEWIWAEVEGRVIKKFGVPVGFQLTARDITQRKRAEEERKRYEEKLSALNTYSRNLNTAKSMEDILKLTLDAVEKTLGFEFADILILKEKTLCLATHRGYSRVSSLELPLDGEKGVTARAARTGKPVFVPDINKEEAYVEGGLGMRSELAVPIKLGNKVLGVLNVESRELDAFDEKDQELLEILAFHAATAMSNLEHARNLEMFTQEIKEKQQKFERFFMDNPEAVIYMDSDFRVLDVNPRFAALFGYSLDEIKGKHINEIIVPEDMIKEAKMLDGKALDGYFYYEAVRKRKDGSLVPVSISAASVSIEGRLIGTVGIYRDDTERKRYEERLSALNIYSQKLNMAESMQEIYQLALDATEKLLGFEIAFFMVVDKNMLCVVDQRGYPEGLSIKLPLDGSKRGISVKVATTGKSINVRGAEKEPDWVEFWPGINSGLDVPVKFGNKVLGVIGVDSKAVNAFDEKDQKLLEILASHVATAMSNLKHAKNLERQAREIRESQEKFERFFMDNPEAAACVDSDFRILDVNPRFVKLFGYSLDEIEGKLIDDVVVQEERKEEAGMLNAEALKGYFYYETVRKRKDGTLVPVSVSVARITVEGKVTGAVGLYRDITERKEMEKKLEEYSQHLEELVDRRTKELKEAQEQLLNAERLAAIGEIAAMVGHDLRNPLTGIGAATYYLRKKFGSTIDMKAAEMFELIEKDIAHANNIITDLLEYSREIRLECTETNPKFLVNEALRLVEFPQNIHVVDSTQSEPQIVVDSERMKRVFVNIIKNAIDAMPDGGTFTITSNESNGNLEIGFIDTGIGMSEDVFRKIWTPLFTTKATGMGLGLPICKRFVEAHRGTISVQSVVGKGTKFTVTIPVKCESQGGKSKWKNPQESSLLMTMKA